MSTQPQATQTSSLADMLTWLLVFLASLVSLFGVAAATLTLVDRDQASLQVVGGQLNTTEMRQLESVLSEQLSGDFFTADIAALAQAVQHMDWLDSVSVKRIWPNTIQVHATPRFGVARFGSRRLIDENGVIFTKPGTQDNFDNLPRLYGAKDKTRLMMSHFYQVNRWFEPLHISLTEVLLTDTNTWLFRFNNGLRVLVDKQNAQSKLYQLAFLLSHQLQSVTARMESIDLRYRNGMAVLWKDGEKPKKANLVRLAH